MTYKDYRDLHSHGKKLFKRGFLFNSLPSDTDPTQDLPIKRLQLGANGVPLNASIRNTPFNNLSIDQLSSLDRRNNDKFDVLGELQAHNKNIHDVIKNNRIIESKNFNQNEK